MDRKWSGRVGIEIGDVLWSCGLRIPVTASCKAHGFSDQAPVTGESMPIDAAKGTVFVVPPENGALIIEAKRVGEDTTLARIAQLASRPTNVKRPIHAHSSHRSGSCP